MASPPTAPPTGVSDVEHLTIKASLTADEAGVIEGKAWIWDQPDRVGDVIQKGALKAPDRLPMLFGHDQNQVIGLWDSITTTDDGLAVKGRLLVDDVTRAREVRAMLTSGAVTGLSIGFYTKSARPTRGGRIIADAELAEISVVAVPAHDGARVTSAKAAAATTQESTVDNEIQEAAAPDFAALEQKMTEIEKKTDTSALVQRLDRLEAKANRPGGISTGANAAEIEAKALNMFLRNGAASLDMDQKSNLNIGTNSAGGFVVAPEYSRRIIERITEISPIRQVANVMSIGTTEVFFPVVTTKLAGTWVTENGTRQASQPVFDQVKIETFEHAVIVPVSQQLIEDSFIDLQSYLAGQIAEQFARAENAAFVIGDGSGKPTGFLDNPALFGQTDLAQGGNAEAIVKAVIDTFYSLQSAYAANGSWMMTRQMMGRIRAAADTTTKGAMWSDGLADGTPARLLGRPVYEAVDMDDLVDDTTSPDDTFPVAFGDFRAAYQIVDRVGVQLMRDDFTGADTGIVKMRARRRVGGKLLQPEAVVLIKGEAS
jgi:HK97 family phage major capsid protein/HK97 family phage prohead protease